MLVLLDKINHFKIIMQSILKKNYNIMKMKIVINIKIEKLKIYNKIQIIIFKKY